MYGRGGRRIIYLREEDERRVVGSKVISEIIWVILSDVENRSMMVRESLREVVVEVGMR